MAYPRRPQDEVKVAVYSDRLSQASSRQRDGVALFAAVICGLILSGLWLS